MQYQIRQLTGNERENDHYEHNCRHPVFVDAIVFLVKVKRVTARLRSERAIVAQKQLVFFLFSLHKEIDQVHVYQAEDRDRYQIDYDQVEGVVYQPVEQRILADGGVHDGAMLSGVLVNEPEGHAVDRAEYEDWDDDVEGILAFFGQMDLADNRVADHFDVVDSAELVDLSWNFKNLNFAEVEHFKAFINLYTVL